jgi:hypothetical protein
MAMKLSRMLGTSVDYWVNLQSSYDLMAAEYSMELELAEERKVFSYLDYKYFRDNFGLLDLPRKIDDQIAELRKFLNIASLTLLKKKDTLVSFRQSAGELTEKNIVRANAMVQIATNTALKTEAPGYDRKKLEDAVDYTLTLTKNHENFYSLIEGRFREAGVVLVLMPNISGSKTNGATKRIGNNVMLMVNNRRLNADSFWFTLFHEVGHIINGDYGVSFENEDGEREEAADRFAENKLVPPRQCHKKP